jgi:hypothetical protein
MKIKEFKQKAKDSGIDKYEFTEPEFGGSGTLIVVYDNEDYFYFIHWNVKDKSNVDLIGEASVKKCLTWKKK